jgi:LPS export ABC transporter protein LptC
VKRPLALIAFALATLAACDEKGKAPPVAAKPAIADSADQVMFGVRVAITNGGMKRADLKADTAYMYDDNTRTDMRVVNGVFYTLTGARDATLTSKRGIYIVRLGNMEAMGDVVIVSTRGKLTTPQVRYDPSKNEVASDSAFVMTRPDGTKLSGVGFVSDPNLKTIRVLRAAQGSNVTADVPAR